MKLLKLVLSLLLKFLQFHQLLLSTPQKHIFSLVTHSRIFSLRSLVIYEEKSSKGDKIKFLRKYDFSWILRVSSFGAESQLSLKFEKLQRQIKWYLEKIYLSIGFLKLFLLSKFLFFPNPQTLIFLFFYSFIKIWVFTSFLRFSKFRKVFSFMLFGLKLIFYQLIEAKVHPQRLAYCVLF